MKNYLVTGANGGYGKEVISNLEKLVPAKNIFALVRSEEKGKEFVERGINIRVADYSDKDKLVSALEGIDKVLLVSGSPGNRQAEHKNVIDASKEAGVEFIAYTSLAGADANAKEFPLGDDHRYTENEIKNSGLKYTILRNNWYLENELTLLAGALTSGKLVYGADEDSKVAWVSRDDLAEAGAKVLFAENPKEVVELSGENLTYSDLAKGLSNAFGKEIVAVKGSFEEVVDVISTMGVPTEVAQWLASLQADISKNYLKAEVSDLEEVLGRKATSLEDSLKKLLSR